MWESLGSRAWRKYSDLVVAAILTTVAAFAPWWRGRPGWQSGGPGMPGSRLAGRSSQASRSSARPRGAGSQSSPRVPGAGGLSMLICAVGHLSPVSGDPCVL